MIDGGRSGLIDEVATFSSCTRTELDLLGTIGAPMAAAERTEITVENMPGRECFVIKSGRARVTRGGELVGHLAAGQYFGEMSLLTGAAHQTTVTAETPMELIVLSPLEFNALLENAPTVVRKMLRMRSRAVA